RGKRTTRTGTTVIFWPDPQIFGAARFSTVALRERVRELAFLHSELTFTFRDHRLTPTLEDTFCYPDGLADFVLWQQSAAMPVHPTVIRGREQVDEEGEIEIALCWSHSSDEFIFSWANDARTPLGGTHVRGLRDGLGEVWRARLGNQPVARNPRPVTP